MTKQEVAPEQQWGMAPLEALAADLDALANLQRLRLLQLVTRPRYGEELSEALDTSRQSALKHVKKLQARGFVRALHGRRETGPVIEYQVVPQRLFATSVAVGNLGNLEPTGGPDKRFDEPTVHLGLKAVGEGVPAPPISPAPQLLIATGPGAGRTFPLDGEGPRWTIGRAPDRTLVLDHDPYISSHHCELQIDRFGHALVDAHSANGTFLNFKPLPRGGRVVLQVGDVVGVGHTCLVFQNA